MKNIKGFEGLYSITSDGKIWSHLKWRSSNGRWLKPWSSSGYYEVELNFHSYGKGKKKFKIHRLVAETFIPKIKGKECVNHRNRNRFDNRVENLEWCTQIENINHAGRTLTGKFN